MKTSIEEIEIDRIMVKKRLRQDNGDLSSLERSIRRVGLLNPIVVDSNTVLISGGRRLAASRMAQLTTVPVVRLDTEYDSMLALDVQSDENLCRHPLTSDELEKLIHRKKSAIGGGPLAGLRRIFSRK